MWRRYEHLGDTIQRRRGPHARTTPLGAYHMWWFSKHAIPPNNIFMTHLRKADYLRVVREYSTTHSTYALKEVQHCGGIYESHTAVLHERIPTWLPDPNCSTSSILTFDALYDQRQDPCEKLSFSPKQGIVLASTNLRFGVDSANDPTPQETR